VLKPINNELDLLPLTNSLNANGFHSSTQDGYVTLFNSSKLRELARAQGFKVAEVKSERSIFETITQERDSMVACTREGLVLKYFCHFRHRWVLTKWKTVMEPQGTNVDLIKELLDSFNSHPFIQSNLDNGAYRFRDYITLLTCMREVSTAKKPGLVKKEPEKKEKTKNLDLEVAEE